MARICPDPELLQTFTGKTRNGGAPYRTESKLAILDAISVTFWGALARTLTAGVASLFGTDT